MGEPEEMALLKSENPNHITQISERERVPAL